MTFDLGAVTPSLLMSSDCCSHFPTALFLLILLPSESYKAIIQIYVGVCACTYTDMHFDMYHYSSILTVFRLDD